MIALAEQHAGRRSTYGHDNNFDLMRFLLAVGVILSHCYECTLGGGDAREPLYRLTHGRVSTGGLAVDGFFVISGFLITASWERSRSALAFLSKRVLRIYPGFVASTLIGGLLVGPAFSRTIGFRPAGQTLRSLAKAAAVFDEAHVPGAFAANPSPGTINNPVWTIRWEFACYLALLALGITRLLRARTAMLVLFVGLTVAYAAEVPIKVPAFVFGREYAARHWARLPAFYMAGMVLYLWRDRVPIDARLAAAAAVAVAGSLLWLPALTAALAVAGGYLLIWFAYQRHARWTGFARHGDFSYGIYLYGFPVQQSLVALTHNRLAPLGLFAAATPVSVVAGWASWNAVEKWFVRPKSKRPAPATETGGA